MELLGLRGIVFAQFMTALLLAQSQDRITKPQVTPTAFLTDGLPHFTGDAGFRQVRPEDVPPLLAQRHAQYVRDGLDVVVMGGAYCKAQAQRLNWA